MSTCGYNVMICRLKQVRWSHSITHMHAPRVTHPPVSSLVLQLHTSKTHAVITTIGVKSLTVYHICLCRLHTINQTETPPFGLYTKKRISGGGDQ